MTDDGLSFSLVVAAYNEEDDIVLCLDALVGQTYDDKEIIAVDDASTDRTPEILDRYAEQYDEVTVVRNETNRGVAATRNHGLKRAAGDVVVIINADVVLKPDHLERLVPHYESGADFVVCRSRVRNDDTPIGTFIQAQEDDYLASDVRRIWSEGWSVRRDILESVGGFDERYPSASGEDAALGYQLDEKYERVVDNDIIVPHIAPESLDIFRSERQGRGRGRLYYELLHEGDTVFGKSVVEFGKLWLFIAFFPVTIPLALAILTRRARYYHSLEGSYPIWLIVLTLIDVTERRRGYYGALYGKLRNYFGSD